MNKERVRDALNVIKEECAKQKSCLKCPIHDFCEGSMQDAEPNMWKEEEYFNK